MALWNDLADGNAEKLGLTQAVLSLHYPKMKKLDAFRVLAGFREIQKIQADRTKRETKKHSIKETTFGAQAKSGGRQSRGRR